MHGAWSQQAPKFDVWENNLDGTKNELGHLRKAPKAPSLWGSGTRLLHNQETLHSSSKVAILLCRLWGLQEGWWSTQDKFSEPAPVNADIDVYLARYGLCVYQQQPPADVMKVLLPDDFWSKHVLPVLPITGSYVNTLGDNALLRVSLIN
jgi:hypothetical protein